MGQQSPQIPNPLAYLRIKQPFGITIKLRLDNGETGRFFVAGQRFRLPTGSLGSPEGGDIGGIIGQAESDCDRLKLRPFGLLIFKFRLR